MAKEKMAAEHLTIEKSMKNRSSQSTTYMTWSAHTDMWSCKCMHTMDIQRNSQITGF